MAEKHEHSNLQVLTKPCIFETDHTLLGDKVSPEKGISILVQESNSLQFLLYVMALVTANQVEGIRQNWQLSFE